MRQKSENEDGKGGGVVKYFDTLILRRYAEEKLGVSRSLFSLLAREMEITKMNLKKSHNILIIRSTFVPSSVA